MYRSPGMVISSIPLSGVRGSANALVLASTSKKSQGRIDGTGPKWRATLTNANGRRNERRAAGDRVEHDGRASGRELATDRTAFLVERNVAMPVVRSFTNDEVVDHTFERLAREVFGWNYDDTALEFVIHRSTRTRLFEIQVPYRLSWRDAFADGCQGRSCVKKEHANESRTES